MQETFRCPELYPDFDVHKIRGQ